MARLWCVNVSELTLDGAGMRAGAETLGSMPETVADLETARLARLARQGDRDAFAALVDLHQQSAWRVAMAALGRAEDAEDAAQDAFISAWRNLASLRNEDRFRPWLMSIVWRKALDRRRGLRSWLRLVPARGRDTDLLWTIEQSPDAAPTPEGELLARGAVDTTRQLIAALPRKLRDPLLLAAGGEHRYDAIAAMLGVPLGTVKWRVSEARRIVKAKLARLDGGGR